MIHTGYYGRLNELRRDLETLIQGGKGSVEFEAEHLSWMIEPWPRGSGDELVVTGVASLTFCSLPQMKRLSRKPLTRENPVHWTFQFEMLTSRIAESWLEDLGKQLDEAVAIFGYH